MVTKILQTISALNNPPAQSVTSALRGDAQESLRVEFDPAVGKYIYSDVTLEYLMPMDFSVL